MNAETLIDILSVQHPESEVLIATRNGCFEIISAQQDNSYQGKILFHAGSYIPADWENTEKTGRPTTA